MQPKAPDWFPDWRGQTAVIVASGPSAKRADLSIVRGRAKVIAINNSWTLIPWADVLYGCDFSWWKANKGVRGFLNLKISQDAKVPRAYPEIKLVQTDRVGRAREIIVDRPGLIGWGGNGGFQALNLAVQFGARKIVLVGYDMTLDHGMHWHGAHPKGMNNPRQHNVTMWRQILDGAAGTLKNLRIEVINASSKSALTAYPKTNLSAALSECERAYNGE